MTVSLLRNMFEQMVVGKNAELLPRYYHPDFRLYSNGVTQDYRSFAEEHEKVYVTAIRYAVEYDEHAWVEAESKVAGRVWITTTRPGEAPTRIEVVLIAAFDDGRIRRLWEITWPNWADIAAFEDYATGGAVDAGSRPG
jgi:hypothetical protein